MMNMMMTMMRTRDILIDDVGNGAGITAQVSYFLFFSVVVTKYSNTKAT